MCWKFLVQGEAEVRLTCLTDSAACRGICQRLGAGRVRHLQCAVLWVQQAVRSKQLRIGTISGSDNPADIGTKPLGGSRIRELLWTMGCLEADGSEYGLEDYEAAQHKKAIATALKELKRAQGEQCEGNFAFGAFAVPSWSNSGLGPGSGSAGARRRMACHDRRDGWPRHLRAGARLRDPLGHSEAT